MSRIIVIVDNPLRDLPACTLVASKLASLGHEAFLVPFDDAPATSFLLNPDYVLLNYARITNEKFILRLKAAGIPIGILDTEGGVFVKLKDEDDIPVGAKTFSKLSAVNNSVADYFVWGQDFFQYLKTKGPFRPEILHLTGTPRTDFLHPSLQGKVSKDILLINTSFTLANPKFRSPEEETADLIKRFSFNEKMIMDNMQAEKTLIQDFLKIVIQVAEAFPQEKFVLRPHPFEGHKIYHEKLGHLKNLKVQGDLTIDRWLARSKAIVHFQCSTSLEASLMNVPAFAMGGNNHLRPLEWVEKTTDYCLSPEDLISKLQSVLQGSYKYRSDFENIRTEMIQRIYFQFDGKASDRVVSLLTAALQRPLHKNSIQIMIWTNFYRLKNLAKQLLGRHLVRPEKGFSLVDVDSVLQILKSLGIGKMVHIQKKGFAVRFKT